MEVVMVVEEEEEAEAGRLEGVLKKEARVEKWHRKCEMGGTGSGIKVHAQERSGCLGRRWATM
jgi:hypothetical protein